MSWNTYRSSQTMGKQGSMVFSKYVISNVWIESTENKWNSSGHFPGFTTLQILAEIQNMMTESKCELEQSKRKIIFMSMFNDIHRVKRVRLLSELPSMFEDSRDDIGRFQGHARTRNGTQLVSTNLMKNGKTAAGMMLNFCRERTFCIPCLLCFGSGEPFGQTSHSSERRRTSCFHCHRTK